MITNRELRLILARAMHRGYYGSVDLYITDDELRDEWRCEIDAVLTDLAAAGMFIKEDSA